MNWYILALKNSFNFKGRAGRKEYWYTVLFSILIMILLIFLDELLQETLNAPSIGIASLAFSLFMLIPYLSLMARRFHDVNKSATWLLVYFIPFGALWILFILISPSYYGRNRWGTNPDQPNAETEDSEILDEFMINR